MLNVLLNINVGTMKTKTLLSLVVIFSLTTFAQSLYQGPAKGTVASGSTVSTNSFLKSTLPVTTEKLVHNKVKLETPDSFIDFPAGTVVPQTKYVEDKNVGGQDVMTGDNILLKSFNGMPQNNSIPSDAYCAAGPNHIIGTINSAIAIWDKNGNRLKSIDANGWFGNVVSGVSSFDPKVIYDQISNRWVIVFLDQKDAPARANILVSVSEGSSALGTWYNYAFPCMANGATVDSSWLDYEGVGYDDQAIYFTGNQWTFPGSSKYAKIRIVSKAQLYANTAGPVDFTDFWDIRYPQSLSSKIFGIRPTRMYTTVPNEYYFLQVNSGSANYCVVYTLKNALTAPVLTGKVYSMSQYSSSPSTATQLGGAATALEAGGSSLRNEPVYRDGILHVVHTIQNPSATAYGALHYFNLDIANGTMGEDYTYGASGYHYIYPSLAVDKNSNVGFTYSRTGDNEYIGAFFSTKKFDAVTISPSKVMQAGKGNYVVTYSGTRNRWGDYSGAWLDPNEEDMWMMTEYVSNTNAWGTWVSQVRVIPYPGVTFKSASDLLQTASTEVGYSSTELSTFIINTGSSAQTINDLSFTSPEIKITTKPSLPISLGIFDTLKFGLTFTPNTYKLYKDTLVVTTTSGIYKSAPFQGKGYVINKAPEKSVYAASLDGNYYSVNKSNGSTSLLGASTFTSLLATAINPKTNITYALRANTLNFLDILRVAPGTGEAFLTYSLNLSGDATFAFDKNGVLFVALKAGNLFRFDETAKTLTPVDSIKTNISAIAFHPLTNQLWGTVLKKVGAGRDKIFKVNLATGDTTNVGNTGFTPAATSSIFFDEAGTLYGVKTTTGKNTDFISIDTSTGVGTIIGATSATNIIGLAYGPGSALGIVKETSVKPDGFKLDQNYPNPFNPSTKITFSVPDAAFVNISIYNVLGEKAAELFSGNTNAGSYSVTFDASGLNLGSGVFFYKMTAKSARGEFSDIKKMILVK